MGKKKKKHAFREVTVTAVWVKKQMERVFSTRVDWLGVSSNSLGERNKIKGMAVEQFMVSQTKYGTGATKWVKMIFRFLE